MTTPFCGKLVGVANYATVTGSEKVVLKIPDATTDYYVGYNHAVGFHEGTNEAVNQVTIVSQNPAFGSWSYLEARLSVGEEYIISNIFGNGEDLTIKVTAIDPSASGFAKLEVTQGSQVCSNPVPSSNPSAMPSSKPGVGPSVVPSQSPSISPSQNPTLSSAPSPGTASMSPSQGPSGRPSLVPSLHPSEHPSQAPSVAPSQSPTKVVSSSPSTAPYVSRSRFPSAAPSTRPSYSPSQSLSPSFANTPDQWNCIFIEDFENGFQFMSDEGGLVGITSIGGSNGSQHSLRLAGRNGVGSESLQTFQASQFNSIRLSFDYRTTNFGSRDGFDVDIQVNGGMWYNWKRFGRNYYCSRSMNLWCKGKVELDLLGGINIVKFRFTTARAGRDKTVFFDNVNFKAYGPPFHTSTGQCGQESGNSSSSRSRRGSGSKSGKTSGSKSGKSSGSSSSKNTTNTDLKNSKKYRSPKNAIYPPLKTIKIFTRMPRGTTTS